MFKTDTQVLKHCVTLGEFYLYPFLFKGEKRNEGRDGIREI